MTDPAKTHAVWLPSLFLPAYKHVEGVSSRLLQVLIQLIPFLCSFKAAVQIQMLLTLAWRGFQTTLKCFELTRCLASFLALALLPRDH